MTKAVVFAVGAALALGAAAPAPAVGEEAASVPAASADPLPAGTYRLDKYHASLIFRVDHLGFSYYVGRFSDFDATLTLDPAEPSRARLDAVVRADSLGIENPPEGFRDTLLGPEWLDAGNHPEMRFQSKRVVVSGPDTARIEGDFTFRGVTRPLTLEARFNGGWAGHPYDPNARIGFSARGVLKRSEHGMTIGLPEPPFNMGVGDEVEVLIEAEFTGPAWRGASTE
ncbi:MAG: YceI family protein [Amphiplicatus sp.]|jgi:polyisoprenoid-binding protein YceI